MKFLSIHRLLAEGRPDAHPVALRGNETVTWGTFVASIEQLYSEIAASPARNCFLCCTDALEFMIALLAIWHAGRMPIIPANFQKESVSAVAQPDDMIIDHVPLSPARPGKVPFTVLDPNASKIIFYTSGSTGAPKLIEKTLFQLEADVERREKQFGGPFKDLPFMGTIPHQHIYGLLFRLLWPVSTGRAFDAEDVTMPDVLLRRIKQIGPVVLTSSPSHVTRLPALTDLNTLTPYINNIFSAGAPLPDQAAALYAEAGISLIELYGSTEAGGLAWKQGSSWKPLIQVELRIDAEGALEARGPQTHNEWVRTGDRAEMDESGGFILRGRIDRVVKVEGKRISLDDITVHLNEHPWVSTAGIVPLTGARSALGAVIALSREGREQAGNGNHQVVTDSLKAHLAKWFEPVVIPRRWRYVSALPTNAAGKTSEPLLAPFFEDSRTEPIVISVVKQANQRTLALFIPSTLLQFKGHFPEFPILPGVVQVHWAALIGTREFNITEPFRGIQKLKFLRIIMPDTELTLQLSWNFNHLDFAYRTPERVYSSGRLEFKS